MVRQDERSDARLMALIAAGDQEAFAALYDRYAVKVFQIALIRLRDSGLAEEVVNDVFMRCWRSASAFRQDAESAKSWLCRIADHRATDVWRSKQGRERGREEPLPDPNVGGAGASLSGAGFDEDVVRRLTMQEALDGLSDPQKEVIVLGYYGGLSQSEIATATEQPLGTVKTRTRAALEALRKSMRPADTSVAPANVEVQGARGD